MNLTTLKPGAASALRHWHEKEDELVYVLEGEVVLIEDDGETALKAGDAAGFKASVSNGHHWSTNRARRGLSGNRHTLEIRTRRLSGCRPDVIRDEKGGRYTHKDGKPYSK